MSLKEEMWKYEQITGESAEHIPIIKLGAFLDGYEMGIEALEQQSCKDCISREDAINKIEEWADGFEEGGYFSGKSVADAIRACGGIIAELPPVTPKVESEAEK